MTKKKLTKKQKQQMLYNATMIAEGAMDETSEMSYIQAWQWLVDTGECWKLQGFFARSVTRMLSDGTLQPAPIKDETPNNGDEQ
jgi:hypothetical protein